ncbi:winged helix-turn-helix transcriptional regulator [Rhizobium cauense]|uniref:ArsR/SmtB family transcription factor n=1 Tax=Rhizobium cauense TaxID=1166683 RepID=UPI001C6F3C49|nr:metalloregulator ArsR/SmtB family transcription factor [Rhizobium cauense]MBW9118098.1 winged helix-turn-helix transcriptional regulator [Rhizobium cauense]
MIEPMPELADVSKLATDVSALLKVMAHPLRLKILFVLLDGEKTVGWLEQNLDKPQAQISHHLAKLRFDDLVCCRRSGRLAYYRIGHPHALLLVTQLLRMFPEQEGE